MNKILIELEKKDNTTDSFKDGMGKILNYLQIEYRAKYIAELTEEDLNWCDVYIAVRPSTPYSLSIKNAIEDSGRVYIAYFDDDLLNYSKSIRLRREISRLCIQKANIVMSPNPQLCNDYGRINSSRRTVLVDTAVDESEIRIPHKINGTIRFVYAAGRDHARIFEILVKPAIIRLIEKYGKRFELTFIGVHPIMDEICNQASITYVPLMPLDEYRKYMDEHEFDVGLAPLDDSWFNAGKYFNKFFEYTTKGIMGVYSNCLPFTYIINNQENGVLVENNPEEWYRALCNVIDNTALIEKCLIRAQEILRTRFTMNSISNSLVNYIPELSIEFNKQEIRWLPPKKSMKIFLLFDKSNKLINQIKSRGFKGGIELISNHIYDKKKRNNQ